MDGGVSFNFPLIQCTTLTPDFSQQTGLLACRAAASPMATSCSWNAELSSSMGVPLYKCASIVEGVQVPLLSAEYPACFMAADSRQQVAQFSCPRMT